jgi:hypothetical protein
MAYKHKFNGFTQERFKKNRISIVDSSKKRLSESKIVVEKETPFAVFHKSKKVPYDFFKGKISNSEYVLKYYFSPKSGELNIARLYKKKGGSVRALKLVFNKLFDVAKKNNVKYIYTNTWIFAEHPKLAEKLGFKLVPGSDANFNRQLKKYDVKKIISFNIDNFSAKVLTKSGKVVIVFFSDLPEYVLKLNNS